MPSPRSFKFKFHSSAVAPSPSISNQSKTSLISDSAVKINEIKKEDTKTTTTTTTIPSSPKVFPNINSINNNSINSDTDL